MQAIQYQKTAKQLILQQDCRFHADLSVIAPEQNNNSLLSIDRRGHLHISEGFQCRLVRLSPSDVTARASIVYAALCDLMQQGVIAKDQKAKINEILVRIAMEDGLQPLLSIPIFWAQHFLGHQDGK